MREKKSGGFTVTELMTVVAIMGILASIAMICTTEYTSRTKLRTTIHLIAAHIRQARLTAICTSKACNIKFDISANYFTINGTHNVMLPKGVRFGADPGVSGCPDAPYILPPADGVSFDSPGNPNTLTYHPTGLVVPAGTVYITDGKQTMAVRVSSIGRPKSWRSSGGSTWKMI